MPETQQMPPRGTEVVLLVVADPGMRKLALFMLEKQGYRVLETPDAAGATRLFAQHLGSIHLLVIDTALPKANGEDLAVRFEEQKSDLRVLFLSAGAGPTARRVRERGAAVLEKPFTMADLAGTVREVLDAPLRRAAGRT